MWRASGRKKSMSDDTANDDKVGYRRPPKRTQFKKGQSGNPGGRPPSKKKGRTDIAALLDEPIKVTAGGKAREMQPFEAAFRQLARKALGGDLRAMVKFVRLCEEYDIMVVPRAESGGGVLRLPKGVSVQEWLNNVTKLVLADEG
ncbi:MAG: DUF5681 domain-containing protein [Pseudomonadota bacterium]